MSRLLLIFAALTMVCRYTVRDVAFVDLGDENYRLVLKIADPQPATLGAVAEALGEQGTDPNPWSGSGPYVGSGYGQYT